MSCRPDLYKARTAIERLLLDLRDVEERLGPGEPQIHVNRARALIAYAGLELSSAVPLIAPPAVIFERLR